MVSLFNKKKIRQDTGKSGLSRNREETKIKTVRPLMVFTELL